MKQLAVNFHYFGEEQYPKAIYPISPSVFRKQLVALEKSYSFISQSEMLEVIQNPYNKRLLCQITFDDGLKQQMKAFKLLRELNIPAVFYVPTLPIFEKKALFVHKLHWIRTLHRDEQLLDLLNSQISVVLTEEESHEAKTQYRYDTTGARELKYTLNFKLSIEQKEAIVHQLFLQAVGDEKKWCEWFYMDEEDLSTLAHSGSLGSHGHSHIPLATSNSFKEDIARSSEYLLPFVKKISQISFSYPYGSPAAVDAFVALAVREQGYAYAYTMWRGTNETKELENPFLLKRIDTNDAPGGKNPQEQYL